MFFQFLADAFEVDRLVHLLDLARLVSLPHQIAQLFLVIADVLLELLVHLPQFVAFLN
jgi:hypothetical protein